MIVVDLIIIGVVVLDQLAVIGNLMPGQRDNWGLNTYRESTLLFGEATGGEHSRYEALKRIARALSHSVSCSYKINFALALSVRLRQSRL